MFKNFEQLFKFNDQLFELRKKQIIIFIILVLFLKFLLTVPSNSNTDIEDLKINVNTASLEELQKVPYIGEKTALKIIKFRENYGYIENINQLKNIRNFKRFKYYIKTK